MATIKSSDAVFQQSDPAVNYVIKSDFPGDEQCAFCKFFKPTDIDEDGRVRVTRCTIVEPWPEKIGPDGYCLKYEEKLPFAEEPLLVEVEREQRSEPASRSLYITPKPLRSGLTDKLMRRDKAHTLFGRAPDGMRLAIHVTSNGYEDRDKEHVATKALQEYVDSCYKQVGEDIEYIGDNPLLFWHNKRLHIGNIVHADMYSGFLVEVSKERDTPIAHIIWNFWEASANDGTYRWGTSHAFPSLKSTIQDGKTVHEKIKKKETSVLLWEAAANQLTTSEVIPMVKSRDELLDVIFSEIPNAAEMIKTKPDEFAVLVAQQGLEAKNEGDTADDKEVSPAPPIFLSAVEKMLDHYVELVEAQADLDERIEAQKEVSKAFTDDSADVLKRLETVEGFISDTPKQARDQRLSNITPEKGKQIKDDAGVKEKTHPMWDELNSVPSTGGQ
jgi:hypothetical protein